MAKHEKPKSGFVIKLSNETVQKLVEEEEQAKSKSELPASSEIPISCDDDDINKFNQTKSFTNNLTSPPNKKHTEKTFGTKEDANKSVNINDHTEEKDDKSISSSPANVKQGDLGPSDTSWGEYAPYINYEGDQAVYTDPSSQQKYNWNHNTNAWDLRADQDGLGRVYSYEKDTHIYTEPDGSKFFYDVEKKAWIPKVDDDFLAYYQMSYGFIDNTSQAEKEREEAKNKVEEKKQQQQQQGVKRKNEPQWFQPSEENNTKVYVSNLPSDLTEEEFVDFMQKCGLVERDLVTHKMKIKLYMDKDQNCFKGDALCTYIKKESVDLALNLLDGSDLKGNKIKVEKAHFQLKGEYNPSLKPKKKKKKELEKLKKIKERLFDWRPEKFVGERSKHERVVIIKNLFQPSDFDKDVQLILDYQQDLREESSKCGEVKKVVIYDRHPDGVAQITMKEPEMADAVVQLINGRWFGKRQITAEIWDGRTKYRIAETEADLSKRINSWDKFLEQKEETHKKESSEQTIKDSLETEIIESDDVTETCQVPIITN